VTVPPLAGAGTRLARSALVSALVVVTASALVSCQTALAPPEARKLPTSFEAPFVPPPRTIVDVTAVLDQHQRDIGKVDALKRAAAQTPPSGGGAYALAHFYYDRAYAFRGLGLVKEELADWREATRYAIEAGPPRERSCSWRWPRSSTGASGAR
jgi:hypothetical protein